MYRSGAMFGRRHRDKEHALDALRQAYRQELVLHGDLFREIARQHGASEVEIEEAASASPPRRPPSEKS
jgi:cytidylate kinase